MPDSNSALQTALARVEAKVDSQQESLNDQKEELGKISDAIVTLARLDEHLLRFREEDRADKKRLWETIEEQGGRLRNVENSMAKVKDFRAIGISILLTIAAAGFAFIGNMLEFK